MADSLRSLVYLIVALTFLSAFVISAGRVVAASMHYFQTEINEQLYPFGMHVVNPSGEMRRFNPAIQIEQLDFLNGSAHGIEVEINLLQSLLLNRFVARLLIINDVRMTFDLEAAQASKLNLTAILDTLRSDFEFVEHSDELDLHLSLTLARQAMEETWLVNAQGFNTEHEHHFRVYAGLDGRPESSLSYHLKTTEPLLWLRANDYTMSLDVSNLPINTRLLTGQLDVPTAEVNAKGSWQREEGITKGHIDTGILFDHSEVVELAGRLEMTQLSDQPLLLRFNQPKLQFQDQTQTLPNWRLGLTSNQLTGELQNIDVAETIKPVKVLMANNPNFLNWLEGLDPDADIRRLEFLLDADGWHWFMEAEQVRVEPYLQMPKIVTSRIKLSGTNRTLLAEVNGAQTLVHIQRVFNNPWDLDSLSGLVLLHYENQEFGLSSWNLAAHIARPELPMTTQTIPVQQSEDRFQIQDFLAEPLDLNTRFSVRRTFGEDYTNLISVHSDLSSTLLPLTQSSLFYPKGLETDLNQWQQQYLSHASFFSSYLSMVSVDDSLYREEQPLIQLDSRFTNATVNYMPDWPLLENVSGSMHVNEKVASIWIDEATTLDSQLTNLVARFPLNDSQPYSIQFNVNVDAQELLAFVQASELKEWLTSVHPTWEGKGLVNVDTQLLLPYQEDTPIEAATNQVSLSFYDVDLNLNDLAIELQELNGNTIWNYPYAVNGELDSGLLFDRPLSASIETRFEDDLEIIDLNFLSGLSYDHAQQIAGIQDTSIAQGEVSIDGNLLFYPGTERDTELLVSSDLIGLSIDFPAPIGKPSDEAIQSYLQLTFNDAFTAVEAQNLDFSASLLFDTDEDAALREGTVAVGTGTALPPPRSNTVVLTGLLNDWEFEPSQTNELDLPLEFQEFRVSELLVAEIPLTDAIFNGTITPAESNIALASNEFTGTIRENEQDPFIHIHATRLQFELDDSGEDPLGIENIDSLVAMTVKIDELLLKDAEDEDFENWGSWNFTLESQEEGVVVNDLDVNFHEARFTNQSPIWWYRATNQTRLQGQISGTNMAEVLTGMGNTANIESESYQFDFDLTWPGSPLAFDFDTIQGNLQAAASSGRFVDIAQGSGAMRLFGLLNFSKVLNRLSLDFQDIVQPGLHFDSIEAIALIDQGVVNIVDPARVKGPGSELLFEGTLDSLSNRIDAELMIRFPLNKSLQAYATYLALINPVAGIGLWIGADQFDRQINNLVSGSYEISGALDDPEITLKGVSGEVQDQN